MNVIYIYVFSFFSFCVFPESSVSPFLFRPFSFRGRGKSTHEENICIFKVLHPEARVFSSSENDTFPLEEATI